MLTDFATGIGDGFDQKVKYRNGTKRDWFHFNQIVKINLVDKPSLTKLFFSSLFFRVIIRRIKMIILLKPDDIRICWAILKQDYTETGGSADHCI